MPGSARAALKEAGLPMRDGMHAASHALLNILPAFMMCAASDMQARRSPFRNPVSPHPSPLPPSPLSFLPLPRPSPCSCSHNHLSNPQETTRNAKHHCTFRQPCCSDVSPHTLHRLLLSSLLHADCSPKREYNVL